MASESYYHPIRECGILVILLLFSVGSKYNGEGQGLMQFISCNSVTVSPLSFHGSLFLPAGRVSATRTSPPTPRKPTKNPGDCLHQHHFVNTIEVSKLINKCQVGCGLGEFSVAIIVPGGILKYLFRRDHYIFNYLVASRP